MATLEASNASDRHGISTVARGRDERTQDRRDEWIEVYLEASSAKTNTWFLLDPVGKGRAREVFCARAAGKNRER